MTEAGFLQREIPDVEGPILDDEALALAERIMAKYPVARSATVPLLYLVQSVVGWVPRQGMREVADLLGLRTAEVEAVATFYTMLKLHPTGRYVLSICTNPSCSLLGGKRLLERATEAVGGSDEHISDDGLFTVEEEECLAACDQAPVVAVNYLYYDRVGEADLARLIDGIRAGRVPPTNRGGVPGELREISLALAGVNGLRSGPVGEGPGGG